MGNKLIQVIDNTDGAWMLTTTTMSEMYDILNGFLTGERRDEESYIPRNKVNHLIAWLPNIEAIVIEQKDEEMFFNIRFHDCEMIFKDSGLEDYFVEMIKDGDI